MTIEFLAIDYIIIFLNIIIIFIIKLSLFIKLLNLKSICKNTIYYIQLLIIILFNLLNKT